MPKSSNTDHECIQLTKCRLQFCIIRLKGEPVYPTGTNKSIFDHYSDQILNINCHIENQCILLKKFAKNN